MANQIMNYLANFKAEKNGNITHTRIGNNKLNVYGGSYNIPDKNHLEFMELYYINMNLLQKISFKAKKEYNISDIVQNCHG